MKVYQWRHLRTGPHVSRKRPRSPKGPNQMTTYDQDYLEHFAHFIGELNKQLEVPVLESVEAFENMADNRHVAQMSCVLPAPLAVVLYQRDPDFIADWFTWREQIANG